VKIESKSGNQVHTTGFMNELIDHHNRRDKRDNRIRRNDTVLNSMIITREERRRGREREGRRKINTRCIHGAIQ